jgi:hydrogenase/urease accessory protein HupE
MGAITPTERFARTACRGRPLGPASRVAACVSILLGAAVSLQAHDPGLSALDVRIGSEHIVAVLSLAASDARIVRAWAAPSNVARDSVQLTLDGRPLAPRTTSLWSDESGGIHIRLAYDRSTGSQLVVRSPIVTQLARGHRELLSIRADDGAVLAERMLDEASNEASADVSAVVHDTGHSSARFFALGVRHILTGYDHLLFLAGVLAVIGRWRAVMQTISAFTLAHSITLALATMGLVVVPGRIAEPLIAASIVYVGLENLLRPVQGSRWKLTFGFGLIHGLGFATALRGLGVGTTAHGAIMLPLASFNAGVEAGQMAVAAAFVPILWRVRRVPGLQGRSDTVSSLLVVATGAYWLVDRLGW